MKYFGGELSELHSRLGKIIRKPQEIENTKKLFTDLHSKLHMSCVYAGEPNEVDALITDLSFDEARIMPTAKDETIAWAIWHITRIEDLTMGILVAEDKQLFGEWKEKIGADITDTGNALDDEQIMELSRQINFEQLLLYRNAVGKRTRDIVENISAADMKRAVRTQMTEKIMLCGGVTGHPQSQWLLDYWGGKDAAGLLLMPPTRHLILHLNDCCRWKQHIREGKKVFKRI